MLNICVSFGLLAHESRDLSQAETWITLAKKAKQIHKMTLFPFKVTYLFSKPDLFEQKSWFAHLVTSIILDSVWDKSRDSWANSKKLP